MPFIPPFGSPPGGGAGATIELDNLGTVAINASLLFDADSAYDIGDSTNFVANLYVADTINMKSSTDAAITIDTSETNRPFRIHYNQGNARFRFQGDLADHFEINLDGVDVAFSATSVGGLSINSTQFSAIFPTADSAMDLGKSTRFFDETFTDELILTNVGAAAAAADKLVLSAIDLTGGNTILDINTEGTGVEGTGTPAADKTIAIRVNGSVRYLLASTVAS